MAHVQRENRVLPAPLPAQGSGGPASSTASCNHAEMCGDTKKRLWYPTKLGYELLALQF